LTFSVIIQSYLGDYPNSATNKASKLIRAINSVIQQTYKNFEVIVVSDGCKRTVEIVMENFSKDVSLYEIAKQPNWSGAMRNIGQQKAVGDWVVYLDTDDMFGIKHLAKIYLQLKDLDWYWFDDMTRQGKGFAQRRCYLKHGFCGTSNIVHCRGLEWWADQNGYAHDDWNFIKRLMKHKTEKIETPEYYVCHIPFKGGYDI
jgi:glycosyltransferase involved in cell wall biosynthesis